MLDAVGPAANEKRFCFSSAAYSSNLGLSLQHLPSVALLRLKNTSPLHSRLGWQQALYVPRPDSGKLGSAANSLNSRLDILYSFPRRSDWQGLKKNHWQEVRVLYCYLPATTLKAFHLNHVCYLTGVGDLFLQSFSLLGFSPRDLSVFIGHWSLRVFLVDVSHVSPAPTSGPQPRLLIVSSLFLPSLHQTSDSSETFHFELHHLSLNWNFIQLLC